MFRPAGFQPELQTQPSILQEFFSCLCYRLLKVINQADADAWTKWKMLSYIFETVPILHGSSWCQTFNKWINPNFRGETKILMALKMEMKLMTEMTDGHRWKETMLGIAAISRTFEMTLAVWKFSAMIFTSFFFLTSSDIHFVPPNIAPCIGRAPKRSSLRCFLRVTKSDDPCLHLAQPVCSLANWNKWPLNRINVTRTAAALLLEHSSLPTERDWWGRATGSRVNEIWAWLV